MPTLPHGRIECITGCMYSGKSSELIRRVRRLMLANRRVQIFKSSLDRRYDDGGTVSSHNGHTVAARPVCAAAEIRAQLAPDVEVVAIDEVQFLDADVVALANELADRGCLVIAAGIDLDFRGRPLGPMPQLLTYAEVVDKLTAICVRCGQEATRNQRLIDGRPAPADGPTILVGAADSYESRCRHCHEVPGTP